MYILSMDRTFWFSLSWMKSETLEAKISFFHHIFIWINNSHFGLYRHCVTSPFPPSFFNVTTFFPILPDIFASQPANWGNYEINPGSGSPISSFPLLSLPLYAHIRAATRNSLHICIYFLFFYSLQPNCRKSPSNGKLFFWDVNKNIISFLLPPLAPLRVFKVRYS